MGDNLKAVILAAGVGSRIRPLTDDRPKSLIEINGRAILERMLGGIIGAGIDEVVVVTGYLKDNIEKLVHDKPYDIEIEIIENARYAETNTAYSLMLAKSHLAGSSFLKFDADVIFEERVLARLLEAGGANILLVDGDIHLGQEEVKVEADQTGKVTRVGKEVDPKKAIGESIGIERIDASTSRNLFHELETMMEDPSNLNAYYEAAYERLIEAGEVFLALDITGLRWVEIDTIEDFNLAKKLFTRP
ncbi:MAG: phosphocholine cytidylyltransferase family protein [Actinomycetota bacterium]|nr:phosphocholine cytidylyltransferase family protein [Actinomycetota bacterium]